jgi:hypothetical protein
MVAFIDGTRVGFTVSSLVGIIVGKAVSGSVAD